MYFDTHAHYDDERFDIDRYALLEKMPESGVTRILNPGCDEASSCKAMELAEHFGYVYAAVGWHPQAADEYNGESERKIRRWAQNPKVRAIGEIGLDYYYEGAAKEVQRHVFTAQLQIAADLGLPAIVHDRDAHGDCMDIVRAVPQATGVFHCYAGSSEMAEKLLALGWYLSFTGAITFKGARRALETIAICPLERIMLETDSPYLTPVPHRGERNDSRQLPYIAQVVAEIKGLETEQVAAQCTENAKRFFSVE